MRFISAEDEPSEPTPSYTIKIATDLAPSVLITSPAEAEISLPADGLLAVDATLGDDFGLTAATLKLQEINDKGEVVRDFKPKPYRDGKPFLRESDKTYPTRLEYKDSIALKSLTADLSGKSDELREGTILQYWVEAEDNSTEPKPNVGKSEVKRVRIAAPPKESEKKQQHQQTQKQRGAEEQKHQQQQDQQLQGEKRDPPPQLRQEEQPKPEPKEGEPGSEGPKQNTKTEEPKKPNESDPKGSEKPEPKQGGKDADPMQPKEPQKGTPAEPMGQPNEPPTKPETTAQPRETNPQPMGDPPPKPGQQPKDDQATPREGTTPPQNDPNKVERQAQDVQDAIDQQNRQPGEGRNQGPDQAKPAEAPADKKPTTEPPQGGQAEQKTGQPTDPQGQPMGSRPASPSRRATWNSRSRRTRSPSRSRPTAPPSQPKTGSEATGDTPKHPPVAGNTPHRSDRSPRPARPTRRSRRRVRRSRAT